jgi:hypothetical protein
MASFSTTNRDGTRTTTNATTQREAIIKADRDAANRGTALSHIQRGGNR